MIERVLCLITVTYLGLRFQVMFISTSENYPIPGGGGGGGGVELNNLPVGQGLVGNKEV